MPKIKAIAPAKINLTFDILGLMGDGYHQVETLLQAVDLCDTLLFDIEFANDTKSGVTVHIDPKALPASASGGFPVGDDNLIAKSIRAYCESVGMAASVRVALEKSIPMGAGLAGGSADAAAALAAINHAAPKGPLPIDRLQEIGANIGADVPFCISGGTAFGTARGDQLEQCESALSWSLCIVKPAEINVSTPWAYKAFDQYQSTIKHPNTQGALSAVRGGDCEAALASFGNVFEPVIFGAHPSLVELKETLLKHGAWYVQLSGSGPALFAIVPDIEHAHFVRRKVLDLNLEFHICASSKKGVEIEEWS